MAKGQNSRFGDLTFKNFVAQIVNKLTCLNLYSKFNKFKTDFLNNINSIFCKSFELFKKFDLTLEFYFFKNLLKFYLHLFDIQVIYLCIFYLFIFD